GNPIFVETMNAMGGNGVAMGYNELYSALQTHVVDGAENNPPSFLTANHYQVVKVYSLTGHLIIPEIFVFSKKTWDEQTGQAEAKLKAAGVQFVAADKAAFYQATQPIRDKYGAKYAALLKRILDTK